MNDIPAMPDIPLGRYRHYKGDYYELIAVGPHSETLEPYCIYVSESTGQFWVRPADMWTEMVEVKRFEKVD